jgi:hypothetical protein
VTCIPAARAIMKLLIASSSRISLPIDELYQVIVELRNNETLPLDADLFLLEGMCHTISELAPENHIQSIEYILGPIATSLSLLLTNLVSGQVNDGSVASQDLISIYFGNAIFCLLTFNHFVISLKQYSALNQNFKKLSNQFEKIPIKCVFMFFLIYVIPMPLGFNITKLENSKYKIQIGSIETDKIRIALLRLAYLGYQILLLSLVILNFILSFHLIKLILKRNRLIKSNKLKFNFRHFTKTPYRKKKIHIKCLLMIIWITFLFSSIHLNSFLYNLT